MKMYQLGEVEETITVTIGILNNEANSVARPSRSVGMGMNTILNIISRGKHGPDSYRDHGKHKSFFSVFSVVSVRQKSYASTGHSIEEWAA
jgi:hypothetical protein